MIVMDPPREGVRGLIDALAALGAPRVVYVSCDPATLARDVDALVGHGYRPLVAQPIDLMPQTAHVEVVLTLERTG
jgi:23S rRNA (uracil1939-C5)-methyltransferase